MPLKTPSFWSENGAIAKSLLPLSCIYLIGHKIRTCLTKPYKSTIPVLCIGGVVAGGSGKTPVVHAIVSLIREQGLFENPVILTRGYGGELQGPTLVDLSVHGANDVGDEAILHAAHAPTIVSRNRAQGALLAEAMDADLIIMDDGLQNNSLEKTLSFLVIDRRQGVGNGYLLPAGPLREPLKDALAKCAAIIQTNGKADFPIIDRLAITASLSVVSEHDKSKHYVAFSGLGHPEKFKRTLEENGFILLQFAPFADHHPYTAADIEKLKLGGGQLLTTEKDFVRIPAPLQKDVEVVRVVQEFDRPREIIEHLNRLRS